MNYFDSFFQNAMLSGIPSASPPPPPEEDPFQQAMQRVLPQSPAPDAPDPFVQAMHGLAPPPPAPPPEPAALPRAPIPDAFPPPDWTGQAKATKPVKLTNDQRLEAAAKKQTDAIANQGQIQAESAHAEAMGTLKAVKDYQDKQQSDMEFQAKTEADIGSRRQNIEAEINDLGNRKIDPGHLYKEASTPALIGGAILAFLGGWQSTKTGKPNQVLEVINKLVNDDIQAQMTSIETKRAALGGKQTLLQQDLAAGHDAMDARVKASALAYDTAIKAVSAEAARIGSPAAMEKAQQLIGQIDQQKAQTFEDWQAKRIDQENARRQTAIAGGHLALAKQQFAASQEQFKATWALEVDKALQAGNTAKAAAVKEQGERAIFSASNEKNGTVLAPRKEVADEINKKIGTTATTLGGIDRLIELRNKNGGGGLGIMPDDERKEAESIIKQVIYDISLAQEQGQVKEGEMPTYNQMVGDPTAWRDTVPRLKAIRTRLVNGVNNDIEARTGAKLKERWDFHLRPPGATADATIDEGAARRARIAAGAGTQEDSRLELEDEGRRRQTAASMSQGPSEYEKAFGVPTPEEEQRRRENRRGWSSR